MKKQNNAAKRKLPKKAASQPAKVTIHKLADRRARPRRDPGRRHPGIFLQHHRGHAGLRQNHAGASDRFRQCDGRRNPRSISPSSANPP